MTSQSECKRIEKIEYILRPDLMASCIELKIKINEIIDVVNHLSEWSVQYTAKLQKESDVK